MNTFARLALVASISLTASALADRSVAAEDGGVRVAALQPDGSAPALPDSALLDEYAGRYEIGDGRVFIVTHEANSLVIELPVEIALPPLHLEAVSLHEFRSVDASVRVVFEVDADGRVIGAVVHVNRAPAAIVASKATPRGIVLIYDLATASTDGNDG